MKKIVVSFIIMFVVLSPVSLVCLEYGEQDIRVAGAFSSGYVFKNDHSFKEVYGHGVVNVITADGCCYPWQLCGFDAGIGVKVSYWRARGKTSFLELPSLVQQVPFTVYGRIMHEFECCLQAYISLGGGFTWMKEKSYLDDIRVYKGIGEVEVGVNYPIWRCITFTGVFRYVFPPQSVNGARKDVGGCDLRGGFGFQF